MCFFRIVYTGFDANFIAPLLPCEILTPIMGKLDIRNSGIILKYKKSLVQSASKTYSVPAKLKVRQARVFDEHRSAAHLNVIYVSLTVFLSSLSSA